MHKFWLIYHRGWGEAITECASPQLALETVKKLKELNQGYNYYILESIAYSGNPPISIDIEKEKDDNAPRQKKQASNRPKKARVKKTKSLPSPTNDEERKVE